jgi:hypothetical protein
MSQNKAKPNNINTGMSKLNTFWLRTKLPSFRVKDVAWQVFDQQEGILARPVTCSQGGSIEVAPTVN